MIILFILKCSDDTFYTGVTTDIDRRLDEHNNSSKGAKYTKARRPVTLAYCKKVGDRSEAQKEEYRVRKLSRDEKISLVENFLK